MYRSANLSMKRSIFWASPGKRKDCKNIRKASTKGSSRKSSWSTNACIIATCSSSLQHKNGAWHWAFRRQRHTLLPNTRQSLIYWGHRCWLGIPQYLGERGSIWNQFQVRIEYPLTIIKKGRETNRRTYAFGFIIEFFYSFKEGRLFLLRALKFRGVISKVWRSLSKCLHTCTTYW